MRNRIALALWLAAALAWAGDQPPAQPSAQVPPAAQPAEEEPPPKPFNGYGYGYFVVGGACCGSLLGFGAGGDALLYKGLGVSADLGYIFPRQDVSCGIGLLSVNASYHFVNRHRPAKVMPFVTAGYALGFRATAGSAYNYGGGVTWWLRPKLGLRLEVRDYRHRYGEALYVVRTSVAFR